MPKYRKVISVVVFILIVTLSYVSVVQNEFMEDFARWLNMYDMGQMWMLDAARVFQMIGIFICTIQLADFLSERDHWRRYWMMLAPFPLAFLYLWVEVSTFETEVFPRNGIIAFNFLQGFILLSYSRMLGFLRTRE